MDLFQLVNYISNFSVWSVFLDADHYYETTLQTLKLWWPKIQRGGFFAWHDYNDSNWQGVTQAVDEWIRQEKLPLQIYNHCWLVQKP